MNMLRFKKGMLWNVWLSHGLIGWLVGCYATSFDPYCGYWDCMHEHPWRQSKMEWDGHAYWEKKIKTFCSDWMNHWSRHTWNWTAEFLHLVHDSWAASCTSVNQKWRVTCCKVQFTPIAYHWNLLAGLMNSDVCKDGKGNELMMEGV